MWWEELFEVARARHGVVCVGDVAELGGHASTLRRRADREGWTQLHPGVWVVGGVQPTVEARLHAAQLATGGMIGMWSALYVHGLDRAPSRPQVILDHTKSARRCGAVMVRRSRTLREVHGTVVDGLRVTTVARTIADLAGAMSARDLLHTALEAERLGVFDRSELAVLVEELRRGVPGLRKLHWLLRRLGEMRSDSGREHEVRAALTEALAEHGIIVHPEPFPYRCRDGVVVELDIAVAASWVAIEFDGKGVHLRQRGFTTDRTRWNEITEEWRLVWVTNEMWSTDRDEVIARVLRVATARAGHRPPATPAP